MLNLFFFQTFHTPSFGDEDFDIPVLNQQNHVTQHPTHQTHQTHPSHQTHQETHPSMYQQQQQMHDASQNLTELVTMDQYQQQQLYQMQTPQEQHINIGAGFVLYTFYFELTFKHFDFFFINFSKEKF